MTNRRTLISLHKNINCVVFIQCFAFIQIIQGIFSDEISTAHLIVPRKVDGNGVHLSHNLNHSHGPDDVGQLHYHIELHNETLHLELVYVDIFFLA